MEVATTNKTTTNTSNHHHHHNFLEHHNHHQEQQRMPHHSKNNLSVGLISETVTTTGNGVGAVGGGGGGARSPFQREVREWQRIDPDTGALLSGRLEADRWINGPMNSYGKISDSQNISQPNGTQHTQRKQLEVLQARTANGAMQVIRTQTSSRWSSATSSSASSSAVASPTIISSGALTNGHNNHNNNNSTHNSSNNISNNFHNSNQLFQLHQQHLNNHNNMKNNHFQSPSFGRLDLSPPPLISTLEITEVSNDDSDSNDHNVNHFCSRSSSGSSVQSSNHDRPNNGSDLEDIDDDSKSDVVQQQHHHHHYHHQPLKTDVGGSNDFFNRHSFLNKSHNNITNRNLSLLMETLDTAPSLKLSNLMKSNSSLSSNNSSSSNNSTTATMNSNTHQRGGSAAAKISLHAIVSGGGSGGVGGEEPIKQRTSSAASSSSSTTKTTTKTNRQQQKQQQPQQRKSQLLEQATLYGNNSVNLSPSLTKSRVGVNADESVAVIVDCANAAAAVVDDDDDNDDDHNDGAGRLKRNGGNMTPTQLKTRQHHRDLESFRHYNEHGNRTATSLNTTVAVDRSNEDNDDVLRLNSRHRRHQQASTTTVPIQRSRSISTENLNSDHRDKKTHSYENDEDEDLEPSEWKRVSKLRRSFQSSNSNSSKSDISIQQPRRPIDLPTNSSVSVAKIRAELENGRRLNTAMRNNHIDLAALDSILNGSADESSSKPIPAKRNSFLTAESLKEIRAGLKKLSDESLYRDDYVAATQAAPDEHIEIQDVKKPPERIRLNQPTPENFAETTSAPKSAFEIFTRQAPTNSYVITAPKHTTHSLESRQKHRDSATSIDWHLRRKSYGFEKMSPPDDKAMCRMDASTDSGLGRSGEQLGNWSPTNTTNAPINTHATVIQFGTPPVKTETNIATSNTAIKPAIQKRYRPLKSPNFNNDDNEAEQKRHSIAVDESQYVRKISQVRVNSVYNSSAEYSPKAMQTTRFPGNIDISNISNARNNTQQKRVEFCKTEVHFAAESGRVNIVETDGKPPPTNNFRRRRRTTSGPLQTLMKSSGIVSTTDNTTSKPITLFGDAANEHKVLSQTTVAYRASLIEAKKDANADVANSVTFTMPKAISLDTFGHSESSRSSYASTSTSGIESTDCETDEISAIRGILKNKPIKPKPYHLGENIDSADALWGVRLKSVDAVQSQEPVSAFSTTSSSSVGERVRLAEQRQDAANSLSQVNNFSTKINLSLGNECNTEQQEELPKSNVMSIELHSPQTSLERHDATKLKEGTTTAPIPKPRTFTEAKNMEQPQIHIATTVKQTTGQNSSKETNRDFLKIVKETRGARKLREHELSYFGVPIPTKQAEIESNSKFTSVTQFPKSKRSLPQRKQNDYPRTELISDLAKQQQLTTKWQLFNDKPDLLQHSPVAAQPHIITRMAEIKPTEQKSLSPKSPNCGFENDEHVYENIATDIKPVFKVKSPVRMLSPNYDQHLYDRKADLKRDAMILNEMTQSADQTMKAISDEAAIKEQRRHRSSSQRRHAKPLETIDEKIKAEKINGNCIAVQITRSTTAATDAKRMTRQGTPTHTTVSSRARTSSQSSSNDSCPRARSRSLSSEREYETFNVRSKRTSQSATRARPLKYATAVAAVPSRSSSRESATHVVRCCSSGDERDQKNIKRVVRSSRSRQTTANAIRSGDSKKTTNSKDSQRHHHHSDKSQRRDDEHSKKRVSSSTAHSSRRERVECNDEAKTQQHSHHSSQHKSYERSLGDGSNSRTGESSSSRSKPREEQHKSLSSSQRATASDKRERDRLRTNEQQHHNHQARESSQHRSSHQRTDRDKEKSSRSKGHSSRSSQQKSSDRSVSSKTREQQHKKSTQQQQSNTESKNYEPMKSSSTHSKNIPLLNGHQHQHHHHHHQHQQQKQQEPHNGHHNEHEHKHKLTTATIAAKQREHRSGKDRK